MTWWRARRARSSRQPERGGEAARRLGRLRTGRLPLHRPLYRAGEPDAAARVAARIEDNAAALSDLAIGRAGRVNGTYENVLPGLPYIKKNVSKSSCREDCRADGLCCHACPRQHR